MRLLFLSRWFPSPPSNGSKLRIFNLLKQLSTRHEITLVSFTSEPVSAAQLDALRPYCCAVHTVAYRAFHPTRLKALAGLFARRPRWAVATYSPEMARCIRQVADRRQRFDAVIASELDMAPYAALAGDVTKILEDIELTSLFEHTMASQQVFPRLRSRLTWLKVSAYVAALLRQFDGYTVVSTQERTLMGQLFGQTPRVMVVPNGVDYATYAGEWGAPVANTLVYTGALGYTANFDAVHFFLDDILPIISAQQPHVRFAVTGSVAGVPLANLPAHPAVTFTGHLADVRPSIAGSWASVVPLRQGGGTRLKILESLAIGTPVVSTTKGAEGLDLLPGRDLLIADAPGDFAAAVVRLLNDQALRERLCHHGRAAATRYDWRDIGAQFNTFIEECVAAHSTPLAYRSTV